MKLLIKEMSAAVHSSLTLCVGRMNIERLERAESCNNTPRSNSNTNSNNSVAVTNVSKDIEILAKKFLSMCRCIFYPKKQPSEPPRRRPPSVLLYGTISPEDHFEKLDNILEIIKDLHGNDGLKAIGFEYRSLLYPFDSEMTDGIVDEKKDDNGSTCNNVQPSHEKLTRLFHIESNTFMTMENRMTFIADGVMYEEMARLCQEFVQDRMIEEGNLHWITVCDDKARGYPIRVLIDKNCSFAKEGRDESDLNIGASQPHKNSMPSTLLIATGKGKVQAGIFSRNHLLCSSIEESTALPMVVEARQRGMNVVIVDPNARGERNGMETFKKSMDCVFGVKQHNTTNDENCLDTDSQKKGRLFILSHSASGSQLASYLLSEDENILSKIEAMAFTDSTHSVRWLEKKPRVLELFQSKSSLYVRSSNKYRDDDWSKRQPGDDCETDEAWKHRFGDIKTIHAGTTEHSTTNWTAHPFIWQHFDGSQENSLS